ncbi:MAG: type II toxin-antitoxin system prevent-host-death family antitoxin [Halanaerobiaceae bacterium]
MIISSTEIQNNFGKYLMLTAKEPIIITKNGKQVAKLSSLINDSEEKEEFIVAETSRHIYGGREASFEEYLELTQNNEERYEYIDGEIYHMASPRTSHQKALSELAGIFYNFFQGKNCTAMITPYDITLKRHEEDKNIVQPDLMIICDLEENLDERDYYMGIPELVVEILSKSTRDKDLIKKLDLYKSCGIKEYWIADRFNELVMAYLFEDKRIADFTIYREDETAESYLFSELTVKIEEVFS